MAIVDIDAPAAEYFASGPVTISPFGAHVVLTFTAVRPNIEDAKGLHQQTSRTVTICRVVLPADGAKELADVIRAVEFGNRPAAGHG